MKSKVTLFLLAMVICASSQAQENALAKVHYTFIHINDTTQHDKKHQDEMVLYLGQNRSYYTSYASYRMQEQVQKQMEDPAFDGNIQINGIGSATPESYFFTHSQKQLKKTYKLLQQQYLLDQEFPVQEWIIGSETRDIGGYVCQKAEADFKGRRYTAWFTTEIPFQAGPWKLQGLPGLILEAYDQKKEVNFLYAGFDKLDETTTVALTVPENAVETDEKSLTTLVEAVKKNPAAAAKASAQSGGGSSSSGSAFSKMDMSRIKSMSVQKSDISKSPVTNNPIELAD